MYPHQNLDRQQRNALDRLRAPRLEFSRYWQTVTVTDPDGKGVHFYPRIRRTWAFRVKGWPVIVVTGRVQDRRIPLPADWPLPERTLRARVSAWRRLRRG